MIKQKISEQIMLRLESEARLFCFPNKRLATLDRLKQATDAIESGEAAKIVHPLPHSMARRQINQSNVEKFIRAKNWSGPVRETISSDQGLKNYVSQREAERHKQTVRKQKRYDSSIDAQLDEIKPIELQKFFREEVEKHRSTTRLLHQIVNGVRLITDIDISTLMEVAAGKHSGNPEIFVVQDVSAQDRKEVRNLLARFRDEERLIGLGLQCDGGDIVTPQQAEIVLKSELNALERLLTLANTSS